MDKLTQEWWSEMWSRARISHILLDEEERYYVDRAIVAYYLGRTKEVGR